MLHLPVPEAHNGLVQAGNLPHLIRPSYPVERTVTDRFEKVNQTSMICGLTSIQLSTRSALRVSCLVFGLSVLTAPVLLQAQSAATFNKRGQAAEVREGLRHPPMRHIAKPT